MFKQKVKNFFSDRYNQILVAILVFAAIIRLIYLFIDQAVWWDAADYLTFAKIVGGRLVHYATYDFNPRRPFFLALLWGVLYRFGANEIVLRFTEFLFSMGIVLLTYLIGKELYNININVIPLQEFLMNLIFYVILIAFVLIVLIFIYYKLIIPKRNKKKLILNEYKQIFEDILKLENLYILHKSSGEFLFSKTYTSEKINSEILNDVKSFISSFNDSMKSQNTLKEINYNSKILLLIDGNYILLGAILNKEGSDTFKNYLKECIVYIEALYKNELPNKYVKSNLFVEIEKIFEDKLNISIILPLRIECDIFDKRLLKAPYSKDLYNILNNLIKESGNKSFYLSELLIEFSKQTGKGFIEFFICIKELKDNNLLTSINKAYLK